MENETEKDTEKEEGERDLVELIGFDFKMLHLIFQFQ